MFRKQLAFLALMFTFLFVHDNTVAVAPVQLDVRSMKDSSIDVAETALESEKYTVGRSCSTSARPG